MIYILLPENKSGDNYPTKFLGIRKVWELFSVHPMRHKESIESAIYEWGRKIRTPGPIAVMVDVLRVVGNEVSPSSPRAHPTFA